MDEPPVFSQEIYTFSVEEESIVGNIGRVTAKDPDAANKQIRYDIAQTSTENKQCRCLSLLHTDLLLPLSRYSILDDDCPIAIHPFSGQLSTKRTLDREMEATHVFQVRAQEEPSGTSHTHLFILFPLNNRTSDKELKPCVFSNKAYREGVRGAKKDGVFSPSSSSGFIEGWECNTLTRIFYRFNILPQHLVDPHGKERASRKITLVAFFAHLQLPNQNYIFLDLQ